MTALELTRKLAIARICSTLGVYKFRDSRLGTVEAKLRQLTIANQIQAAIDDVQRLMGK